MDDDDVRISEVMSLAVELGIALGVTNVAAIPGCWECVVDDDWTIAINGHREPTPWRGGDVPPFHLAIEWHGFPVGFAGFRGGVIAAGELANENTLCAALRARLAAVQGDEVQP